MRLQFHKAFAITFSAIALLATTAAMPAYAGEKHPDGHKRIENQDERRAHMKEKWDSMSDSEKAAFKEKHAEKRAERKAKWDGMSDDEKAAHKAKAKERWQNREGDKTRIDDRVERRDDRRDERKTAPRIER